jgi:hypothetical protein
MSYGYRSCAGCNEELERREFSRNQWAKGVGRSRCTLCIQENVGVDDGGFGTARVCHATRTRFDWVVHASGSFRDCCFGRFTGGARTNQVAVAKWFRPAFRHMEESFFRTDSAATQKALELLSQFNNAGVTRTLVRLNVPEDGWTHPLGWPAIVEPYIEHFEKFNSNSGWVSRDRHELVDVLQALSHYSYHVSGGQFLLCDLQGGIYRDGVVLTDPVVCSRTRRFGPPDLGDAGMSTFFARHRCGRFCARAWSRPRNRNVYFPETSGTSMEHSGGHYAHRRPMSYAADYVIVEEEEEDDDDDYYY